MTTRAILILVICYTLVAIAAAVWHFNIDPSLGGFFLLHALNVMVFGFWNIYRVIDMGVRFGWKS